MGEPTREELKAELEEMKRQMELLKSQLHARQSGSGAIAQGSRSVAAGKNGIAIAGDVYGNIHKYKGEEPESERDAIAIYLRMLISGICHLPLRGIDIGASDPKSGQKRLGLDKVYVALDTTTVIGLDIGPALGKMLFRKELSGEEWKSLKERNQRPMTALEAVGAATHIVILGDPGSGKSSFLNHLALCIAMHHLEPRAGWLDRLPSCPQDLPGLLPIMVILRDFARSIPENHEKATPSLLWDFICSRLKSQNLLFASRYIEKALNEGKALVLLDGLDEISVQSQPLFIKEAVSAFAERYPQSRMIVTCRTLSYQDANWHFTPFPAFQLAPFNEEKIDRFITAWYEELKQKGVVKPEEARALASGLKGAVRSPDLWRMAPNPLLLTVMALVHTHEGCLPDARALLYEKSIDILLWRWEQIKIGGCDEKFGIRQLLHDAGCTDVDLKRVLWRLAFEAHKEGGTHKESLVGIGEHHLEKGLAELHPEKSRDWAMHVIDLMKLRAGLLLEREPEVYTFPHRTFQEFLAGAHLASQGDFFRQATSLVEEGPFWRQVILLAVGRLVYLFGDLDKPLALVGELCPLREATTDIAWRKIWLAGEVIEEAGIQRVKKSELGKDLYKRVQSRLASLLHAGALTPVERAAAGNSLGRLGDPRFRADAWYLPDEPQFGFVEIPEGPFTMGEGKEAHTVNLPLFYIARYPVTVAQFRAFTEETGYQPQYPDYLEWDSTHPVVNVTWHDALRYCDWLTSTLMEWKETPEPLKKLLIEGDRRGRSWRITLPSEAEWEKAARGTDGRTYPWGNEPDTNHANYDDSGIGTTSPVGCFPGGASHFGILDMSGNVWEWVRSLEREYPYNPEDGRENLEAPDEYWRVLRGGSFFSSVGGVRCAVRFGPSPMRRYGNYGFRVVASPITSGL